LSTTQWTKEQQQAISARGQHLLVAAGAGAGKTAVLVERIIQRITDAVDPIDVDQLLVVTFTNAAAAEMRERIGAAIAAQLAAHPDNARLARQLALLGRASIATLHSFCLDLLRQHFHRLELDPSFRIADITEAELLRTDVLEKLFEEQYQAGDEEFLRLVDAYGGTHDDGQLQAIILQLDNFAGSHPDPEGWLQRLPQLLSDAQARSQWLSALGDLVRRQLGQARSALLTALDIIRQPDGPLQYLELVSSELQQVELALDGAAADDWDGLKELAGRIFFGRLPSKRSGDKELRDQAREARNTAKEILQKLGGQLLAQNKADLLTGLDAVTPGISCLCQLTQQFRSRYSQAKQAKGLVDFNDLEHMALTVLSDTDGPSPVAWELRQRYAEVLVDEYQDINGVQEAILQLLTDPAGRQNQLFMVGDVKQSIYRFRLADPTLFLRKYRDYGQDPQLGRRIDLAKNFRSRAGVLAAINFLFRQLMTERVGELVYDRAAELQPGATYAQHLQAFTPEVEVMLLERSGTATAAEQEDDPLAELDATSREARRIGWEIRRLVTESGKQVWDKRLGSYRPLAYRDIVILMRATSGRANAFMEQLRQLEVPAYAELANGYFQTSEIQTMLSLLQVIDNPRQDIPLAAVLRSPLLGLNGTELVEIRLTAPGASFYEALLAAAEQQSGALGEKLQQFLAGLERWRERSRRSSLSELIWQIYRDTGYYTLAGAMPGGAQRQANLRALHDRARQYEQTSFRGLFRFLRFIERLQAEENDLGTARALGENEDVVRIMSVHKSKGLEFPVVFVAGLGNRFNLMDLRRDLLIHKDLGLGPLAVDWQRRVKYPTLPRLVIEQRLLLETLSEELRVLYVALTRAREKLYLVGSQRNLPQAVAKWLQTAALPRSTQGALPEDMLAEGRCFLDWLGPALVSHPQAASLLQAVGVAGTPPLVLAAQPDGCSWRFQVFAAGQAEDVTEAEVRPPELDSIAQRLVLPDHGWGKAVAERLGWNYPHAALQGKHVKVSVSELKRRFETIDEEAAPIQRWQRPPITRPAFMQQSGLSAAEVGSAIHLLLQHVDLSQPPERTYLELLRQEMLSRSLLTAEEAERIDLDLVQGFLQSEIGCRLRRAEQVWRELPFSLRLPAEELYGQECAGEQVFIQGIIDCVFREGDRAVLLDFKSDNVTPATLASVADRYKVQIDLYSRALSQLFRLPISQRYLYFLRMGRAVQI
jgi:ATP-dependent helicase/nuclease subunit A